MTNLVRIGTRKSKLALAQANQVAALIKSVFPNITVDLKPMSTIGDRVQDRLLSEVGGKGLFAKELEERLIAGDVDIVVHSLKDLETKQPEPLQLTGVLTRHDPRDVMVSAQGYRPETLPDNARFGTASVRRAAQLQVKRPDITTAPLRGNVETRIRKIEAGDADFTLLAKCGLDRLGITPPGNQVLDIAESLPAVGQGFIAVQSRKADADITEVVNAICDAQALVLAECERAVQDAIDGNCQTAMAAHAVYNDAGDIELRAELFEDGQRFTAAGVCEPPDCNQLGRGIGQKLLLQLHEHKNPEAA